MVRPPATLTLGLAALTLTGCAGLVGHSGSTTDYAHKAANTAEAISSSVSTALFAMRLSTEGKITSAAVSVSLREAADDASATADGFDSVQPPGDKADAIRTQLDSIDEAAVAALQNALIHARRGESLGRFMPALQHVSSDLDDFHPGYGA